MDMVIRIITVSFNPFLVHSGGWAGLCQKQALLTRKGMYVEGQGHSLYKHARVCGLM